MNPQLAKTIASSPHFAGNPNAAQNFIAKNTVTQPSVATGIKNLATVSTQSTAKVGEGIGHTVVRDFIAKPVAEVASTIVQHPIKPWAFGGGTAGRDYLYGTQKVQPLYGKDTLYTSTRDDLRKSSNPILHNNAVSNVLGAANTGIHVLNDIPVIGTGLKAATKGTALIAPHAAEVGAKLLPKAAPAIREAGQVVQKGAQTVEKAASKGLNLKPSAKVTDAEEAALARVRNVQQGKNVTVNNSMNLTDTDMALHDSAMKKLGATSTNPTKADRFLLDRQNYREVNGARSQTARSVLNFAKEKGVGMSTKRVSTTPHEDYHSMYADALHQMDAQAPGGNKFRAEENGSPMMSGKSPFYRQFREANGKAPTKADYKEEAIRQLKSGKADPYAQEEYNALSKPTAAPQDKPAPSHPTYGTLEDFKNKYSVGLGEVNRLKKDANGTEFWGKDQQLSRQIKGKGIYSTDDLYKHLTRDLTTPAPVQPKPAGKPQLPMSRETASVSLPNNTPKMSIPEDAPSSGTRTRGLAQTIQDDPNTPQAVKDKVNEVYKVRNTKDLQSRAANLVKEDPALAQRVFNSDSNSDVGTMIGGELSAHLSRTGQHEAATEIAVRMAREATNRGQANQALSAWGKLAPESILRFAQTTVNDYNKGAKLIGTRNELKITPEQAQGLTTASEQLQKMAPGREKDIATQKMLNQVKELIPASWVKKLGTTQTIGQLLNPKTLIRNIVGNSLFNPLEAASQTLATGLDKTASAVRGSSRTTALPQPGAAAKGFIKGAKEQFNETKAGVNLGPDTQYDLKDVPTFRKGAMARVEKTMGYALRVPDKAAFQAAYDDTVTGLMKANKLKQPTQEILDQAEANGLYRTFQDNSKAAELFTKLKGALNAVGFEGKDGAKWGLGDLILKYPKTPGNLISRGLDYSPVGIVKGMYQIVKPVLTGKEFDQHTFANATARGVVGTGALMGAGAALGALGIITEKPSQDTDTRNLQKASGQGGYQINTSALKRFFLGGFDKNEAKLREGDTLVSYDWAQPASIPLSAGAAIGKKQSAKDATISSVGGIADGLNTLVEQPLVTGVNTFANNIKNKGVVGAGIESLKGAPASFVPTLSNQARQLTDNTTRNTYSNNTGQQVIQSVENKIPGLDRRVPARIDTLGNEQKNYQNGSNNLFNVTANPAFVNKYQPKGTAKLPLDIMDKSGETKQMPRTPQTSQQINGKNVKLTPQQNQDFAKYVGSKTDEAYKVFAKDPAFQKLGPEEQAKKMSSTLSDINKAAKVSILGDGGKDLSKGTKSLLNGSSPNWTDTSVAKTISPHSQKVLQEYNGLSKDKIKEKAYKENDYDYKVVQAKYENDKANGKLTRVQDINRQQEVTKAKVGSKFSKDIRDIYGSLDKSEVYNLVSTDADGKRIVDQLLAYGDALKTATGAANKFRDSKGNVAIKPKDKAAAAAAKASLSGFTLASKAAGSGTSSLTKAKTSSAPNTKSGVATFKRPPLKKYTVAKTKINLNKLAKLA